MKRLLVILCSALCLLGVLQAGALARSRTSGAHRPARVDRTPVTAVDPAAMKEWRPAPAPTPVSGDLIEISIHDQRLTAWHDGTVVMRLVISTGRPGYETPTGRYHVIYKDAMAWSSSWKVWMPWALNWNGNYFIHQLPNYPGSAVHIGASELGRPASHGCVRVNVGDAERLFHWAHVGTPVWVH